MATEATTSLKPEGWDERIKYIEGRIHGDLRVLAEQEGWSKEEVRLAARYVIALVRPSAANRLESAKAALTDINNRSITDKVEAVFLRRVHERLPAMPGLQELQFAQPAPRFGQARLEAVAQEALKLLEKSDIHTRSGYELVQLTITNYATVLPELAPDARLKAAFELALRDRTGNPMTQEARAWARWKAGQLLAKANTNL